MSKDNSGSVTGWIADLRKNDPEAQRKIWERFVDRLIRYAARKLCGRGCRIVDAEDITNIAFASFFAKGPDEFGRLLDRNDLWQVLAMLAGRRAIDQIRREHAGKHGGGMVVSESAIDHSKEERPSGMDNLASPTLTADFEAILAEEVEVRLDSLNDLELQQVAIERMQGFSNKEIAARLKVSLRSVERKLKDIRDIFETESRSTNNCLE
jgi:RNA polymerase sigma factor (sigma-70 family)